MSFTLGGGERLGIVGESGAGKSLTAMAAAQLLDAPAVVEAAVLEVDGHDPRRLGRSERMPAA